MTLANLPPLVTVFGGSGFVGRHVVRVLAQRGYRVRVAVRRPDLAGFVLPFGNVGQISLAQANLRYRDSVAKAVEGASVVINCVGLLMEAGRNKFDAVQDFGARAVAEAATAAGARLVHVSAIGADSKSASAYAASKGRGEEAILKVAPGAVILRPSIVFGPEDGFFNKFAGMARLLPCLPLIGGGKTKFQPVFVEDVAEAVALAANGKAAPGIYELGGPEVLTFRQCLEEMLRVIDRSNPLVSIPFGVASLMASVASLIPLVAPPLTNDQLTLLKSDNVVSEAAKKDGRTLTGLGIQPRALAAVLPSYLVHFRPHGQYTRTGKAA
ncbi:complex I NDUFA9 subunit family protein [Allorhizobium taibaishanense]|uniref:3-beta hydroxysteroid dehydrogenase n=1 Tax=Allorhizobium taibaishanense TaxID=887144 RepID=A0A1Q9A8J1_9HYPH|nr:complex I NDUFA9 subunit family protein [Allorhizobium taibaishanense]MBB4009561.1 NADH dehydrogenase [Allorhizobium taibaishanense]OLP50910.1 3-beta hydroxysteroid dehydrogenase [Allorhizobium taibaishanense]